MRKSIAGIAFAAINLLASAHATPVLTYVEETHNFNSSVAGTLSGGTSSLRNGFFNLASYLQPNSVLKVRSAEIVARSRDDQSDRAQYLEWEKTSQTSEPVFLDFGTLFYDYWSARRTVVTREYRTLEGETLTVKAGGGQASSSTGATTVDTVVDSGRYTETETMYYPRTETIEYDEWSVCYLAPIYLPYPCKVTVTKTVIVWGAILLVDTEYSRHEILTNFTGNMEARLRLTENQFQLAASNFGSDGIVNFSVGFDGDQEWIGATLNFNYDLTSLVPVWVDVPDTLPSTGPGTDPGTVPATVPEPASLTLLLLGLAGLAGVRVRAPARSGN
jgi:hypothetical protein